MRANESVAASQPASQPPIRAQADRRAAATAFRFGCIRLVENEFFPPPGCLAAAHCLRRDVRLDEASSTLFLSKVGRLDACLPREEEEEEED